MLKPEFTGQFKRDYKLAIKRGCAGGAAARAGAGTRSYLGRHGALIR